nr:hypothetical protein BaRGS_030287 [Batillaria attramentaria]
MTSVDPHTQEMFWDETFCPLHITFPARIAVLVLVFYLPMAALTMLVVGIGLASCSSAVNPHHAFSRPAESLVENDALCGRAGPTSSLGIDPGGGAATFATSSVGVEHGEVRAERGACSNSAPSSHRTDVADAVFLNAQDAASAPEAAPERNFNDDRAAATAGSGSSVYGRGVVGGAIGVGRPSVSEADGSGADLERPLHMAAPLLVTLVCALPLMIGWWFYDDMGPWSRRVRNFSATDLRTRGSVTYDL